MSARIEKTAAELAEQHLSQVDSIMEPEVLVFLKSFIGQGGQPRVKQAIRVLSESYRGRAEMCNLLLEWMEMLGERPSDLHEEVMGHLKDLAVQQFEPRKADTIFEAQKGAPEWLEFMIRDPGWRAVLYKLAEEHSNCLLLNFVIQGQKISEEGHFNELAATATRSGDVKFPVFSQVLCQSLEQLMGKNEQDFRRAIPEFQKLCCQTQYSYMFSQILLLALSRSPSSGFLFRKLGHELSAYAFEHIGDRARAMDFILMNTHKYTVLQRMLSTVIRGARLAPTDVKRVYDLYSGPSPPPVELIRVECVFERLIETLFNHNKPLAVGSKQHYVYLLGYASCVKDNRAYYTTVESPTNVMDTVVDKSKMNVTMIALNEVIAICEDKGFGFHITSSEATLRKHLVVPVCSAGILHWIKLSLHHPDYYSTTYQSVCTPVFMRLLALVASQHPLQRQLVFRILCDAFHLHSDFDDLAVIHFRKQILSIMLHLVHCGLVVEVTSMIASEVPRMDHALVRFFITQILESTAPPYSRAFVRGMFEIVKLPGAELALRNDSNNIRCMAAFASYAHQHLDAFELSDLADSISRWQTTT